MDQIGLEAVLDTSDFDAGLASYSKGVEQAGQSTGVMASLVNAAGEVATGALRRIGEIAIDALGSAAGAAIDFFKNGFSDALEAEQTMARLSSVIESTGGAAGLTIDRAAELGNEFAHLAGGSDDAVLAIEEMALRMGGISADEMPGFIQSTLDLAAATGTDAAGAARLLAQAQEDPISALGRLRRQGIQFTKEQEAQIKAMVKAGDSAGAFALVMDRVGEATAGAAAAQADTLAGKIEALQGRFSEAGESLMGVFIPPLTDLFDNVIAPAIPLVESFISSLGSVIDLLISGDFKGGIFGMQEDDPFIGFLFNVREGMLGVGDFIVNTLVPAFAALGTWLIDNLPPAIEFLSGLWSGTLLPAIEGVWSWVTGNLLPLFEEIGGILVGAGTDSIGQYADAWTNDLLPDLQAAADWVQSDLFPALQQLFDWLAVNLPPAIKGLADFWTGTLLPAMIGFSDFYRNALGPVLASLFDWLQVALPAALKYMSDFWTNVTLPAITAVWDWLEGSLFPTLSTLWTWLSETLTAALTTLAGYWNTTLLPALTAVWAFIQDPLMPLFEAIVTLFNVGLTLAITALAGLWENVLQPAFKTVGDYIFDHLQPVFDTLVKFWDETLGPKLTTVKEAILDKLPGVFTAIRDAVGWVTDKIGELASALGSITLPDWLVSHSPTPFERGLRGIAAAMGDLSSMAMPQLRVALGGMANPLSAAASRSSYSSTAIHNSTYAPTYQLNVSSQRASQGLQQDFRILEMMYPY